MKALPENSIDALRAQFLAFERERILGKYSRIEAESGLISLLQRVLAAGRTISDDAERSRLQILATRIGQQMQLLGLPCPANIIAEFLDTEVGCNGLIVSVGATFVSRLAGELRDAIGVSFELMDLTLASNVHDFTPYNFVIAVVNSLDADIKQLMRGWWEAVEASNVARSIFVAETGLNDIGDPEFEFLRDILPFTDEQSLRRLLHTFLLPVVTEGSRDLVTHDADEVPRPPTPYIVHPYGFVGVPIGRREVFNQLNNLLRQRSAIVVLQAIGGAGKTSAAWEWLRRLTLLDDHGYDGIMWWSFYEAGASYERFLAHAVAYVWERPLEEVLLMHRKQLLDDLYAYCEQKRLLFVLDGLERELFAYSDNFHANVIVDRSEEGSMSDRERRCSNPWLSKFLKTAGDRKGISLLITSRVVPAELDDQAVVTELQGLTPNDGEILWRSIQIGPASRQLRFAVDALGDYQPEPDSSQLRSAVDALGGHPLAIKVLAATIAADPVAEGSLEKWLQMNRYQFSDVFARVSQRTTHVLKYALRGLGKCERQILEYASCCYSRIPVTLMLDCLATYGDCGSSQQFEKSFRTLQSRGLLGATRTGSDAMLYLHPIVAGAIREGLPRRKLTDVMKVLREKFRRRIEAKPGATSEEEEVSKDMINLLYADIQLRDFCDAADQLKKGLADLLLHRCSDQRRTTDVLFPMLATKVDEVSKYHEETAYILNVLGISARFLGDVQRSNKAFESMILLCKMVEHSDGLRAAYYNDSSTARASGQLIKMFQSLQKAIELSRADNSYAARFDLAKSLTLLGRAYALINRVDDSLAALACARAKFVRLQSESGNPSVYCFKESAKHFLGVVDAYEAESLYRVGNAPRVRSLANKAIQSAEENKYVVDFIRGNRLLAAADILEEKWDAAIQTIEKALCDAIDHDRSEEELALHVLRARAMLGADRAEQALESLEEPLSLPFLDSMNVLACEVYLAAADAYYANGQRDRAVIHARKAFSESLCDGAPFYIAHVNLAAAKVLGDLDASEKSVASQNTPCKNAEFPSFFEISKAYDLSGDGSNDISRG